MLEEVKVVVSDGDWKKRRSDHRNSPAGNPAVLY